MAMQQSPWTLEECSIYATQLATGIVAAEGRSVLAELVAQRVDDYIRGHLGLNMRLNTYVIRDASVLMERRITVTCFARPAVDVLADCVSGCGDEPSAPASEPRGAAPSP